VECLYFGRKFKTMMYENETTDRNVDDVRGQSLDELYRSE